MAVSPSMVSKYIMQAIKLSAYASYGESFNPNTNGRDIDGLPLEAQRGDGFELGLKGDWFDNKLGATMAAYRQELTNRPVSDPNDREVSLVHLCQA